MKRFKEVIKGCKEYFQLLKQWALKVYEQQKYFEPNKKSDEDIFLEQHKDKK